MGSNIETVSVSLWTHGRSVNSYYVRAYPRNWYCDSKNQMSYSIELAEQKAVCAS